MPRRRACPPRARAWPHLNAHLQAGMDNGTRVEFHLLMWLTSNRIFIDPPQPENGTYTLPDTPGLGLEPNEDGLKESMIP